MKSEKSVLDLLSVILGRRIVRRRAPIDIEKFGPTIALSITCPNKECGAEPGESCRPELHAIRVFEAVWRVPVGIEDNA